MATGNLAVRFPDPMASFMQPGVQADLSRRQERRLQGAQNANDLRLQGLRNQGTLGAAQIQADASRYPHQLRQQRFDQTFPWVQGQFGALQQQLAGDFGAGGGGGFGGPPITADSVYSPGQIQQQVNQTRAQNDARAQAQTRGAARSLAGRGASSRSPLLDALAAQYQGQAVQASTQAENDLRFSAAGSNAEQALRAQTAREGQFASRQQEANQRRAIAAQQYGSLLSALAGMVG